jgi:plasmid maintenance system antidote protein VapI
MTDLLLKCLTERTESLRAIGRAAGVPNPPLVRFLAGKQTLRLDTAEKLAAYFGIRVLPPKPRRGASKKG